jgi:hypothetical protein
MTSFTHWILSLFLALACSSCMVTEALSDWAFYAHPRSEVLGFVEGRGAGDALIVRVHGEELQPDGVYAMLVTAEEHGDVVRLPVPRRLTDAEHVALIEARGKSSRIGHLDHTYEVWEPSWEHVDAYERDGDGLLRIPGRERKYFVAVTSDAKELRESTPRTKVAVLVRDAAARRPRLVGYASLPPPRRELPRAIAGALVVPVTLTVDIVTFPVQFVVAARQLGQAFERLFSIWFPVGYMLNASLLVPARLPLDGRHLPASIAAAPGNSSLLVLAALAVWRRSWESPHAGAEH